VKVLQRFRNRTGVRYVSRVLAAAVAVLAAVIVLTLTIDLGPYARQYAERAGSDSLERPVHIGSLSIHVLSGRVLVDDVRIDGVREGDSAVIRPPDTVICTWTGP
jgi:cation transport ATPase